MNDDDASTTPLRVATWNLNHWRQPMVPVDTRRGAWAHLADGIGAQVALVQEARLVAVLDRIAEKCQTVTRPDAGRPGGAGEPDETIV